MLKKILLFMALCTTCSFAFAGDEISMIEKINGPKDLKELTLPQMTILAKDIRKGIMNRTNTIGGHFGPDMGIVEATIALHYVFNSPKDKIVYDVSHQTYPHKMLTGRKMGFLDPLGHPEISGYSNPKESEHDHFIIGHTSTSISLATGLAKTRDLNKEIYNVIALIGDGSLSGGEAYEGLNNAATLGTNFIVIVNDNEMSIAENQGSLYAHLANLRKTKGKAKNNIFKALGYDYYYVEEGNDIASLIKAFDKVKDMNHPVVVHIHTLKGKGYAPAEKNKEAFHWILPETLTKKPKKGGDTYASITAKYLLDKHKKDNSIVAITAATPAFVGFDEKFREKMGKSYTDVGIAEPHAVSYASSLALSGSKPVLAIASSFVQRAYDQLSQDIALNNAPATMIIVGNGINSMDMTHLGIFDIPLISNIPNIVYLAPTNIDEYLNMLDWAIEQKEHPVAIRMPQNSVTLNNPEDKTDYSILNKFKMTHKGKRVAIIGVGTFFDLAQEVKKELWAKNKIDATIINPRFISGLDVKMLESLKKDHSLVITLEDGCLAGGFGEKVSAFYANSNMKVLNYGADKEFVDRVPLDELYKRFRLTKKQISQDVKKYVK